MSSILGVVTGHTCGFACWEAREETCRCSCGGANHGILRRGGAQPERMAKFDGKAYNLVAVIPGDCGPGEFHKRIGDAFREVIAERFPDLDLYAYGAWRAEKYPPVLDRKVSASQAKWSEVVAVPGAIRLVWARPAGTDYRKRSERGLARP